MPVLAVTVAVAAPVDYVYRYLRERYDGEIHQSVSRAAKGYVPDVRCLEEEENRRLAFSVRGRDPLLRIFIGGWRWQYDFRPVGDAVTEVTIRYQWSWGMSIVTGWTVRHQAANEIVETALALDALCRPRPSAIPPDPKMGDAEAIRRLGRPGA